MVNFISNCVDHCQGSLLLGCICICQRSRVSTCLWSRTVSSMIYSGDIWWK